jgi:nicotinamide-nucleotide amidase
MEYEELKLFIESLRRDRISLAFAESMTAGLLVNTFSKVEKASQVLKGSIVTYNAELKISLLNVDPVILGRFTAESQETATEMVKGLVKLIPADLAVAVTGLASEGGSESEEKPVGTVFISILIRNQLFEYRTFFKPDARKNKAEKEEDIMKKTVDYIFGKLRELYEGDKKT